MVKFIAPSDRIVLGPGKVTEKVTEKECQVLFFLMEDPAYAYSAVAEKLSISRKTVSGRK